MKLLSLNNLDELAIGCSILGSGGGGNPAYFHMIAKHQLEKSDPIPLITTDELDPESLVMPVGFFGAPLAGTEKFPSGREFLVLFDILAQTLEKKIDVVMPIQIGGAISFSPITLAAQLGLRVLDADMLGRAFPEGYMCSSHMMGLVPAPGFFIDAQGNVASIYANDSYMYEKIGRKVSIAMGSWSAEAFSPLMGKQIAKYTIPKTMSKAIAIGKAHIKAKREGKDPVEAVLEVCKGALLGYGKITDIDRYISQGVLQGSIQIQNENDKFQLYFQNEFLIAKCNGRVLATTPDILMLLEEDTGAPVTIEALQFGIKVNLIAIPAPKIWTTPAGLPLVSPRSFGYDTDYKPIQKEKIKR